MSQTASLFCVVPATQQGEEDSRSATIPAALRSLFFERSPTAGGNHQQRQPGGSWVRRWHRKGLQERTSCDPSTHPGAVQSQRLWEMWEDGSSGHTVAKVRSGGFAFGCIMVHLKLDTVLPACHCWLTRTIGIQAISRRPLEGSRAFCWGRKRDNPLGAHFASSITISLSKSRDFVEIQQVRQR